MSYILRTRWVYHTFIWVGAFITIYAIVLFSGPAPVPASEAFEIFLALLLMVPLIYTNFYLKTKLYDRRKYVLYFVTVTALGALGALLYQGVYRLVPLLSKNSYFQDFVNILLLCAFTVGLQYLKRGIINQYQLQELKARTAEMELNALKTQVNPHFLFNTLNNIYATNKIDPAKGSEMIIELSEVMRYHLHISKLSEVFLEEEIQLIDSYVTLEKLRLRDNCTVEIHHENVDKKLKIAPLILLPFIENAFKHGTHTRHTCAIYVAVTTTAKTLQMQVRNSVMPHKKTIKTGIGLSNTKRRLELIYPNAHTLDVIHDTQIYEVSLKIRLSA